MLGMYYKLYYSAPTLLRRACKTVCRMPRANAVVVSNKRWNKLCMRVVKDGHAYIFKFYAIRRRNCIKINIPLGLISGRVQPRSVPTGINPDRFVDFYIDSQATASGRRQVIFRLSGMRVYGELRMPFSWITELTLREILTQICSN